MVKAVKLPDGTMFSGNIYKLAKKLNMTKDQAKNYRQKYYNIKKETIQIFGKKYKVWNLAKKRKITQAEADKLIANYREGNTDLYAQSATGENVKFNYSNKLPLILREFIKRPSVKSILTGKKSMKGITFTTELGGGKPVDTLTDIVFTFTISDIPATRRITIPLTIDPNNITKQILSNYILTVSDYAELIDGVEFDYDKSMTKIKSFGNGKEAFKSATLFRGNPLAIAHLFTQEVLENDKILEGETCRDWIKKNMYYRAGKSKYPFRHDELDKCYNTNDYLAFARRNNVKMVVYDINGRVVALNYTKPKDRQHGVPAISYIQYNQHIYPVKVKAILETQPRLARSPLPPVHIALSPDEIDKKAREILHSGGLIGRVDMFGKKITAFQSNGAYYNTNTKMGVCKKILDSFGLGDKIVHSTTLINVNKIITFAVDKRCNSFFPESNRFIKGGFNYVNNETEWDMSKLKCIDKRKSYSYELMNLKYLTKIDMTKSVVNTDPNQELIEHYFYVIEPKESSILLPDTNLYWGECVILAKEEGLEFTVIQSYSVRRKIVPNDYRNIINQLYTIRGVEKDDIKLVVNAMIGQMEINHGITYYPTVEKVGNKEECESITGFMDYIGDKDNIPTPLDYEDDDEWEKVKNSEWWKDDDLWAVSTSENPYFRMENKKSIAIQIKDASRMRLYNTMKLLKLKTKDIAYINTDCIAFIQAKGTKRKLKKLTEYLEYLPIDGWRFEELKEEIFEKKYNAYNNIRSPFIAPINNKNILYDCDAGCGKTYNIMNVVIPTLGNDYMVLSSSHSALREYRQKGLNAEVLAVYRAYLGKPETYPEATNIICEEFGMFNYGQLKYIYKLALMGKNIMAYGDYGQLLPVNMTDRKYEANGEEWLSLMFNKRVRLTTNYRNDFTPEYYKGLREGDKEYAMEQMRLHRTDTYKDAEVIIAFTNITRHKYNKMKCDDLGIPYKINKHGIPHFDPENLPPKGTKIICYTNSCKKEGMYNSYIMKVHKCVGNDIVMVMDKEIFMIPLKQFFGKETGRDRMKFEFGYARTLYSIQGESIKGGIYYPDEDIYHLTPRGAYTLISRIKTK